VTQETRLVAGDRALVLGLGVTGISVARALRRRGILVRAVEDRPTSLTSSVAEELGAELVQSPDETGLRAAFEDTAAFLPSPGVPESHAAFDVARATGVPTISEFDLARWWDDRPIAAVTGTDGKTSVTLLTVAMLEASGVAAAAVGNTETPLIDAIEDPGFDAFVVEASSFRLAHSERFQPSAAAWLNFSPDHLDVHKDLASYERAKAKLWSWLPEGGLAVAPADDAVVRRHLPQDRENVLVAKEPGDGATAYVENGRLWMRGVDVAGVHDLPRSFDHDLTNALVAAALATHLGATTEGIRAALSTHESPPHRIQLVASKNGVSFYNDSKATVPHAVITAVGAFESVVLIAGGKNKGLDLGELRAVADRTRAVIAMGDAADEVKKAFDGAAPVHEATDMEDAVRIAVSLAAAGDAVLLSPGCTSFDAYDNYGARGDDFIRVVHEHLEAS